MATEKQIMLIEDLLDELCWTREDITSAFGDDYTDYEDLDPKDASEVIDYLIQERREQDFMERR